MKKIILVGPQAWFVDSFIYFIEKGFKGIVVRSDVKYFVFDKNYDILSQIGYQIVKFDENNISSLELDKDTLVISVCGFGGINSLQFFREFSFDNLDMLYKISKYNKENNCGATIVKSFNGDTGFSNEEYLRILKEKLIYVDIFSFDNTLLEELILKNIDYIKEKKRYILWMETPLERYIFNNTNNRNINRKYISLGRIISSKKINYKNKLINIGSFFARSNIPNNINIIFGTINTKEYYFIYLFGIKIILKKKSVKPKYCLSGHANFNEILEDRKKFFNDYKNIAFGISHFYDIFNNSVNNFTLNKDLFFSTKGQNMSNNVNAASEVFYGFCNNASKDLAYLMNGIIPLIPHNLHNIYKEFIDKKIAILIKNENDIYTVLNISDDEIFEYRKNIYENRNIFTFDKNAEILIKELNK